MLANFFKLQENHTTIKTEIIAGFTTFLTMAYIIIVNPAILQETGMDHGAVFVATCLAASLATAIMGLYANYPVALAPGMGLNAYFTYSVSLGMGLGWQTALGIVFISGVICVLLSLLPIREYIINSIPHSLKMAIASGIGLFLGIIALKNAGFIVADPATFVTLGKLTSITCILAAIGFFLMVALDNYRIPGSIIISILVITFIGMILGVSPVTNSFFSLPPSLAPTFLKMDLMGAIMSGAAIIFAFVFVDLFDTAGTLIGVAHQANMLDKDGKLPRLKQALVADSSASIIGSMLGTSSTTSYIESAAGVRAGGRTGLTAIVVSLLFLAALFFSPLAKAVPIYAAAPALLFVACLMTKGLTQIDWNDGTEYGPAVVTALAMPLTFSIANGIALGFISYVCIKLLSGRFKELNPILIILSILFCVRFATI
ncbi:MAG: NCS2 family permease [Alphaproteobacteria bacterium]|nr:NCS2 family permease [Alphaproteobacteria bacterium]